MQQPTRLISTPFAQEGEKTQIQNVTGEFDNSATYRLGFPPLTMQSIRLGGKPPKGTDFNGVLFDITENISFLCKGGRYQYNAGLSTLIGGYPEGSNLLLDDNVTEVVSTVAGNQNNPNINMTGWTFKPNRTTAEYVLDASGETQQQVNYNGGSKWHSRVGGYLKNERVVLANGDIVKSTADGNVSDPNVDRTGWDYQLNNIVEFYNIEKFKKASDNDDASLMFKRAFDYAATKPYLIYFYAPKGQTYLLKTTTSTDPAVPNSKVVLDLPGNVCFDGNGCTIKIANAFGNYMFMFRQTTYSDGGYFKNFTLDENHTNNPKTTNETTLDRRSVFSMWAPSSSLGSLEFERVIFKDVVGVHQITTSSYKKLSIKWCEVHSSSLEAPFIDRTAFYCGGDAEVLHNKFYSEGKNAVTCIELHNSNSTAMFNVSNGFRYGLFIVPEPTLPRYNPIYQNVVVTYNKFENCLAGIKLWTYAAALPMKDITVEHNNVTLNSRLNTDSAVQAVDYGIGTLPNWTSSIDNLSIQHNTVRFITNPDDIPSSVQHGYNFFALTAGAKYTLTNSNIRFNKCFDSPNSGFNWEFLSTSHLDSILSNIYFSNNETFNAGTSNNGYGARFLNVRKWVNFVSKDNQAIDDREARHTLAVLAVFGGFTEDNILGGFRSVGDKLNLLKITTPYIHYRAEKAFPIRGYVNSADDYRINLKAALKSELLDEKTGHLYKKLSLATDDWATFADVPAKPAKGWAHYGSTFNQIQPAVYAPSIFQIIQSGYLYKAEWAASTAYAQNDQVNAAGRVYKCTAAGISGSTMPTSATTEVDGTVTWLYIGEASITKSIGGRAVGLTESSTTAQIVAALKVANLA